MKPSNNKYFLQELQGFTSNIPINSPSRYSYRGHQKDKTFTNSPVENKVYKRIFENQFAQTNAFKPTQRSQKEILYIAPRESALNQQSFRKPRFKDPILQSPNEVTTRRSTKFKTDSKIMLDDFIKSTGFNSKKQSSSTKQTNLIKQESELLKENVSCCKEYACKENANLQYRDYMEDTYRVVDRFNGDSKLMLLILFDGHGGADVSNFLREKFPEFLAKFPLNDIGTALNNTYLEVNKHLRKLGFNFCGATGTTAIIRRDEFTDVRELYLANVGDSRAVLVKKNGFARRLTYDHKATDLKEANRIRKEGGDIVYGRVNDQLALTRAFGDFLFINSGVNAIPYLSRTELTATDYLLIIASDGIWDVIEDEEIAKVVRLQKDANSIATDLVQTALKRGSEDNISCIVAILN